LSVIKQAFDELKSQADVILVEGAGGWLAPINFESDIADLAIVTELPVILVVGIKLGCINHARISYQAIRASGVSCVGWVAVCLDPEMSLIDENIGTLKNKISAPLLAVMPFVKEQDFERLAKNFEDSGLF
jgi:dethiobiotin synthetase